MKRFAIPGGILPLFRIFILMRLILSLFILLSILNRVSLGMFTWPVVAGLAECLLLLGYLSWPWLEKQLRTLYLPIGLLIATVGPWLENQIFLTTIPASIEQSFLHSGMTLPETSGLFMLVTQIQLVFVLFIPLILVSWQYSFKWVVAYSLGISLLDIFELFIFFNPLQGLIGAPPAAVIARTGLFLFTGFVINRLATEQKERNRQLSHYAATMEQLSTSRERNRLAREIHDTLAHTLSGLAVNLEAVTALWTEHPQQARSILDQSLLVTRNGLVETRRAIQALRAGPLEDLGLVLALKQLALSAAERYNLTPEINLPEKLEELDQALEQCIYRIAEEGLRNLCQHAGASQFTLTLEKNETRLEFSLADNGHGFDNRREMQTEHFGIKGMQERAEAIGGVLSISSSPGAGTILKLVVQGG